MTDDTYDVWADDPTDEHTNISDESIFADDDDTDVLDAEPVEDDASVIRVRTIWMEDEDGNEYPRYKIEFSDQFKEDLAEIGEDLRELAELWKDIIKHVVASVCLTIIAILLIAYLRRL